MPTVIQISDCHLFADPQAELKGIRTRATFLRVWQHLAEHFPDADRLVISGDLTHDERIETYRALQSVVSGWQPRLSIVPGNHDNRSLIREVFGCQPVARLERVGFVEDLPGWRLIGLDSHVPGELHGRLGDEQLSWLNATLREAASTPTVLFVHHPPISVNCFWLDQIGLRDAEELRKTLARHPQVRALCTGHVHQEFDGRMDAIPVLTTPSTGVQFRPRTVSLEVDDIAPGYRVLRLEEDATWTSEIGRVPG